MSEANGTRHEAAGGKFQPCRWPKRSANICNLPFTKAIVRRFADMEVFVEIQENVRGEDMFVIQSTSFPANDNLDGAADHHRRARSAPAPGASPP